MKKHGKMRKRLVAFALGTMLLAGAGTSAAFAGPAAGNIDTTHKGKIIIHKYQNPDDGNAADGTKKTPTTEPVQGVTFTVAKVNDIDLTQNAGWDKAKDLEIDTDGRVKSKDGSKTYDTTAISPALGATGADGKAETGELDLGVYLVTETSSPADVTKKSDPFLVTVPFPNADQGWLYEVNVYPKNTVINKKDKPVKTVENAAAVHFPGDTITWKIEQPIPTLGTNDHFTTFKIVDQLPAGVDAVTPDNVEVKVLHGKPGTEVTGLNPSVNVSAGNAVTVAFENTDLTKLIPGDQVVVKITAVVSANISNSLQNKSDTHIAIDGAPEKIIPSGPGTDQPDTPTETKFVSLTINKVNKEDKALNDAVFKVYPVATGTVGSKCAAKAVGDKEVALTTGEKPAFEGGTQADGAAVLKLVPGKYCVKETTAPVGYDIDPDWATGKVVEVPASDKGLTEKITNVKMNDGAGSLLPSLPLTGAAGFILLTFAGVAIVATAVGTGFVAVGRKKREQEA
ncbi:SpaH/EbpB family LPXTG-anchored major pilin [Arcanobacterium phocae]|uniref:SpaH/EbpB family LPXTG-anchored major pilin n=1 Tax=Arcanobacterium phocae TaxID=131112 RepID=UPI001C0EF605|nr:SpaH/EbpB family LPXTG-anchored major pilin [Arcanobacterium phocae]